MGKTTEALASFENGFNCSQSLLSVFSEHFGVSEDILLEVSCAFGGGMGRRQMTCGAVTGALMVLGLHFGRGSDDDASKKAVTYEKAEAFMAAFEARNGSVNCKELLEGLSMRNPEELAIIEARNLFRTNCRKYIQDAVEILLTLDPVRVA